ncbi:unnamed protein product [Paramecium octaurelia]|uniref:Uncharacterized protein n=1 Tax=Paramecium octaurelia TaxID=43137 RepID=A0A8S1VT10_PAROT|nr:unnamed protein product [Paramecium octaurelia]
MSQVSQKALSTSLRNLSGGEFEQVEMKDQKQTILPEDFIHKNFCQQIHLHQILSFIGKVSNLIEFKHINYQSIEKAYQQSSFLQKLPIQLFIRYVNFSKFLNINMQTRLSSTHIDVSFNLLFILKLVNLNLTISYAISSREALNILTNHSFVTFQIFYLGNTKNSSAFW